MSPAAGCRPISRPVWKRNSNGCCLGEAKCTKGAVYHLQESVDVSGALLKDEIQWLSVTMELK